LFCFYKIANPTTATPHIETLQTPPMTTRINDQSLTGIETPAENDVPLGRGGYINSHPGHRRYISIVQEKKLEYVTCKKHNKTKVHTLKMSAERLSFDHSHTSSFQSSTDCMEHCS